jgi:cobalt-zinc-cadmium efflux system protein
VSHDHNQSSGKVFSIGLFLNTAFTAFELTVGVLTGSLALIADGIHNLTDSLTLAIAYIAERIGRRAPDARRSYGYGRAKIIASLINAGTLVAVAVFIGYEAISRLQEPHDVPGAVVAAVASVGIVINGYIAYLLSKHKRNLNARSAYTNMLYDTLSSVGALIAGLAILLLGWTWLDSVVGIAIAVMLLSATFSIIKDALHILLEGVPVDIDLRLVKHSLLKIDGVFDVDDIHAWTIDNDYYAFSCHLIVDEKDFKQSRQTVEFAKQLLRDKYNFRHSTLEVEFKDCTTHENHSD